MRPFGIDRLNVLLRAQVFAAVGELIPRLADMVVSGSLLGETALAGIAVVMPIVICAEAVANLITSGTSCLFSIFQGRVEREKTARLTGLAFELAVCLGAGLFLLLTAGRDLYLDALGVSGEIRAQAVAYWRWMTALVAVIPFNRVVWQLAFADGETVLTSVGGILMPVLSVGLSFAFVHLMRSPAGAALGSFSATVVSLAVVSGHFLRKTNAIRPKWNFSVPLVREIVTYSLTDAAGRLCQCGLLLVLNRMIVVVASADYLPIAALITFCFELGESFDHVGQAYTPIAGMYLGEGNAPRVRELARRAFAVALVAGLAVGAAVSLAAGPIASLHGFAAGDVRDHGVRALRTAFVMLPLLSLNYFLTSHCLVVGRVAVSVIGTVLFALAGPAVLGSVLGLAFGLDWLWIGVTAGFALALALQFAVIRLVARDEGLLPVPRATAECLNFTFRPVSDEILRVRDEVNAFLARERVAPSVVVRVMLFVEECGMMLADRSGKDAPRILCEDSFVLAQDRLQVVFRDTGTNCDLTDSDAAVTGLRSFIVAGLMASQSARCYLTTIGCNRAVLTFDLSGQRGDGPSARIKSPGV